MTDKSKRPNALKHGATSQEPMLWGERQEDYDALRDGLVAEWAPEGPTEENQVHTLLDLLWRHRRLSSFEKLEAQQKLDSIHLENDLNDVANMLRRLVPDFEKATSKELVENRLATLDQGERKVILLKWPLGKDEDPKGWGARIAKGLQGWKFEKRTGRAEFLAMHDQSDLDLAIIRRERLDAKIEQTIKRLVQLKAAKQAYRQLGRR